MIELLNTRGCPKNDSPLLFLKQKKPVEFLEEVSNSTGKRRVILSRKAMNQCRPSRTLLCSQGFLNFLPRLKSVFHFCSTQ